LTSNHRSENPIYLPNEHGSEQKKQGFCLSGGKEEGSYPLREEDPREAGLRILCGETHLLQEGEGRSLYLQGTKYSRGGIEKSPIDGDRSSAPRGGEKEEIEGTIQTSLGRDGGDSAKRGNLQKGLRGKNQSGMSFYGGDSPFLPKKKRTAQRSRERKPQRDPDLEGKTWIHERGKKRNPAVHLNGYGGGK